MVRTTISNVIRATRPVKNVKEVYSQIAFNAKYLIVIWTELTIFVLNVLNYILDLTLKCSVYPVTALVYFAKDL